MTALTREQILSANKPKLFSVSCPEWGGLVYVRTLTPAVAISLGQSIKDKDTNTSLAVQLAAYLCDAEGNPLFTAEQALQELVMQGLPRPVHRVLDIANRENGMGTEDSIKGNS